MALHNIVFPRFRRSMAGRSAMHFCWENGGRGDGMGMEVMMMAEVAMMAESMVAMAIGMCCE
jgi:hypothetical protein